MDERSYYEKTCQLLEYTRRHLTVTAMAAYVLETMGYPNVGTMPVKPKVLLLQGGRVSADYSADLLTIGMRRVSQIRAEEPQIGCVVDGPTYRTLMCLLLRACVSASTM